MRCDICYSEFQFGHHVYDGKHIPNYKITVCKSCWDSNLDGWSPVAEKKIIAHLTENGIPIPERNAKGWLPRE